MRILTVPVGPSQPDGLTSDPQAVRGRELRRPLRGELDPLALQDLAHVVGVRELNLDPARLRLVVNPPNASNRKLVHTASLARRPATRWA